METAANQTDRYRVLFDTTPCYITVQGPDFRIREANRRFEEDFGVPDDRFCWEIYKGRCERCETCPVAMAFEDGQPHQSEEIVITKDGRTSFVLANAAPIFGADGKVEAVMEVSTNVTELKELQGRMASVGRLVTSLAHTVKGIVMSLDGGRYVVNTGFERHKEDMIKKGWAIVERNISRVTSLVLDILHFAKDREPDWALVDLGQLIHEVTDLFGAKLRKREITLDLSIRPVEPVLAIEKGLHSLLVALLENAVDACVWDTEQEEHHLKVHLAEDDGQVTLTIIDDGIGMDEETRARIFTPMFSTKRGGGTGLGLLVAEKVAKEHDGSIEVVSEPGKGTMFAVRLPAKREV